MSISGFGAGILPQMFAVTQQPLVTEWKARDQGGLSAVAPSAVVCCSMVLPFAHGDWNMKWYFTACLCLMAASTVSAAGELPDELFGIALDSGVESLAGNKRRILGLTSIGGVVQEMYLADPKRYIPPTPLQEVRVSAEKATGRIVGVAGTAKMDSARCHKLADALRANAEARLGITFAVLRHQGDEFYIYQSAGKLMAIGCQGGPDDALLQYQLDRLRE